jgi:hypothetical protein
VVGIRKGWDLIKSPPYVCVCPNKLPAFSTPFESASLPKSYNELCKERKPAYFWTLMLLKFCYIEIELSIITGNRYFRRINH